MRPALPPAASLPLEAQDYYGFLRTPRYRWWKGVLAILVLVIGYVVVGGSWPSAASSSTWSSGP
ncbi:hypothetical protein [Raineyella fluvialis]|uniref:hypothetical protein n=1 Tax=Raineyella fluvialis TaxID=2662261 RepID=UPI0018908DD6|nr:hypothetical protein [Raineyella fluvialis]